MKRTLSILAVLILSVAMFSGCLPQQPASPATPAPSTPDASSSSAANAAQSAADSSPAAPSAKAKVFKLGNAGAIGEPAAIACEMFCEEANKRLNGEIVFEFYPAEQLGNEITMLENLQVDLQQAVMTALDTLSNYNADLNVLSMAFAFESHDHMFKFLNSYLGQAIWDDLDSQGIHVVNFGFKKNPRIFFGKKPFITPADMKGVKYRIPNIPIFEKNARAMGAVPTVVAWSEYPFALMQGVVDAGECSKEAFRSAGLYEACKYVSEVDYAFPCEQLSFSSKAWNSLTPDQQRIIEEVADEVAEVFNETINIKWEDDKKWLVEEQGVTFVDFDKDAFLAAAAPLAEELEKEGLFNTPDLYNKIQELK
jgi:TRAP-type C4-dicarboxylate transport system substrate-binding protein